jgi:proteasome lid subunit RPN8/RPN11
VFYVSIARKALDLVMKKAKGTDREIIGILVGRTENHTIVITEAVSGEQESGDVRAQLPPSTIAKVTDRILKGEIQGRIVGWYHSHPGFGLFMSGTDISTQQNLQQFSSKVTALIVDPETEKFAFFTLHEPQGVVQLDDDQIHVYNEGEEEVPERFSAEPKVPKKPLRSHRRVTVTPMPVPEPSGSGSRVLVIGIVAAMVGLSIGLLLFGPKVIEEPDVSTVDAIMLLGESDVNQVDVPIFRGDMEIRANITIVEGRIDPEGVRFWVGQEGLGWRFLGNTSVPIENRTYSLIFNTNLINDDVYQIKVNFTDSKNHTWHKSSRAFIIDNVPDFPEPRIMFPDPGEVIDGVIDIHTLVLDDENNIHSVTLSYRNSSVNWTKINGTIDNDRNDWVTPWDTSGLGNNTYQLRAVAVDRNKYIDEHYITVVVLHGP